MLFRDVTQSAECVRQSAERVMQSAERVTQSAERLTLSGGGVTHDSGNTSSSRQSQEREASKELADAMLLALELPSKLFWLSAQLASYHAEFCSVCANTSVLSESKSKWYIVVELSVIVSDTACPLLTQAWVHLLRWLQTCTRTR